ncbi:1555_t:CDS:1, partial [Ambispora gerdemannii]
RDGVTRSSNAGSDTSKTPQNYTGTIFKLWEEIDTLFNEKKRVEKRSMARLYPKVAEEIRTLVINHKRGVAISDATIRNFHKKTTKNPKEETLDALKLWVSKQNGVIDTEPESEEGENSDSDGPSGTRE